MELMKCLIASILLILPLSLQAGVEVTHLEIVESGHSVDDTKDDPNNYRMICKGWNPTKDQLIDFFAKAQVSDQGYRWLHDYYSPCIATGTVLFKDGSSGEWGIYDTGYGSVDFKDGANNIVKQKYFLNLNNQWLKE
ncbi:hypothetical protein [Erwinia sp. JH02]|uniref:hypothetical protein n=1 Tax=Erwinia sp. JH02 TaxID=2733394 RepID=UPI0014898516|nr:hypothetical protein [Erwinia sp. JH02]NNS05765.1 hypothetical protein [Erwinia sp. JH02]